MYDSAAGVGVEEFSEAAPRLERCLLPCACVAGLTVCVVTRAMEGEGGDLAVLPALAGRILAAGIPPVGALDPTMPATSVTSGVGSWEAASVSAAKGAAAGAMVGVSVLGVVVHATPACTWS